MTRIFNGILVLMMGSRDDWRVSWGRYILDFCRVGRCAYFFWIQGLCIQYEIIASFWATKLVTRIEKRSVLLKAGLGTMRIAGAVTVFFFFFFALPPIVVDEFVKVLRQTGNKPVFLFQCRSRSGSGGYSRWSGYLGRCSYSPHRSSSRVRERSGWRLFVIKQLP
jgi:hypothetical protein